ncbi:response regulator transcription factor [Desulfotalea psychrophila]|uniref:Related to two-component system response regulator (Nar family) n=1 Tax=Desulfotalea psychrophila (strain LSv54 / DSM 12343) TaxID=177439 RepID=Q6AMC3_DESPS|nr:response regulator transcription factor [Desulfotalea psychrophila]CAG36502.1 related to two-component system response regulator (Nar family) [Desulfotalea psychrophila LSv54]
MTTQIMIVDDHPIFRMGMAELLNQEDDFCVCAVAENIAGARRAIAEHKPDMAIVDITLAGDNGLDLVKEITAEKLCSAVLVLSMHDEAVWAERAIRAGAKGYIMKREASESVISALRNIREGRLHVSPNMMSLLLDKFHVNKADNQGAPTVDLLTDREIEVFRLIGSGLPTREIAEQMCLGVKTIGTYRDRIKQKLCIKTGAELIRRAVLWTEKEHFERED